jgi:hypothetical protein
VIRDVRHEEGIRRDNTYGNKTRQVYTIFVTYEYTAGNLGYTGQNFTRFSDEHPVARHPKALRDALKTYAVGTAFPCAYNPDNPAHAHLHNEPEQAYLMAGIASFAFILGVLMCWLIPRFARRQ